MRRSILGLVLLMACGGSNDAAKSPPDAPAATSSAISSAAVASSAPPAASALAPPPPSDSSTNLAPTAPTAAAVDTTPAPTPKPAEPEGEVDQKLHTIRTALKACYKTALALNPNLSGAIHGKVIVTGTGAVKSVVVDPKTTTFSDPPLTACMIKAMKTLTFDPSADGKPRELPF